VTLKQRDQTLEIASLVLIMSSDNFDTQWAMKVRYLFRTVDSY